MVAAVLVVPAVALLHSPVLRGDLGASLAHLVQGVVAFAAGTLLLHGARRSSTGLRRARGMFGLVLLVAGVLAVLTAFAPTTSAPLPQVVALARVGLVLPIAVALLSYAGARGEPGVWLRTLVDALVAVTALWFTAYVLLLGPLRVVGGTVGPGLVAPATDVVMLGLLVGVLLRVSSTVRGELLLIATGMSLVLASDIVGAVLPPAERDTAAVTAVLATAGLVVILLAALRAHQDPVRGSRRDAPSSWLGAVPHVLVAVALLVAGELALSGAALQGSQFVVALIFVLALILRHAVGGYDRGILEQRVRANEELFRSLVTGVSDLITLHSESGEILYASPAVERVLGRPGAGLDPSSVRWVMHRDDRVLFARAWQQALASPGVTTECRGRVRSADGQYRWMQTLVCSRLDVGSVGGVIVNLRDIHERHELEQQLGYAAHHDTLTGLGNLALARQVLSRCYEVSPPTPATVVLLDLDGFKAVNDTFGHAQGDAFLVEVANRLRACVREQDEVTRIGGDEFVLVLRGARSGVADRVLAALRAPWLVAGTPLPIGASLGIATTDDAVTAEELLRNADLAMYASKASGRNRITPYRPQMHEVAALRMRVHRGLRRALDDGHLTLNYQPIVALPSGEIIGGEALLRWRDPDMGQISPEVFIPIAEESGIISEIDAWVLQRACRDIRRWLDAGLDVPRISVNVSRRHMTVELPRLVLEALTCHDLTGDRLCIEVTETAVVPDADLATAVLHGIRALGVSVSLDDFGSGESSLSQLASLPVDTVKIDRSFTRTAADDAGARRLLTSIVRVCQSLSLPVVAEGIETAELVELLADIGCQQGQGWHFARDESPTGFAALLAVGFLPVRARADDVAIASA